MNKRLFIISMILVIFFVNICYATIYYTEDTFESGGKTVKVVKISQNNAVFEVGGIKNIIMVGEQKNVNGVDVKVISVFYVDEPEARNVDVAVSGTTSSTPAIQEEEDTSGDECWQASDCEDDNSETTDLCMGTPKKCKNIVVKECETNVDCDDGNKCTNDECKSNECFNTKLSDCTEEESETEETTNNTTAIEETQEKQGFFSKIIGFFKNLFGS